jgi:kinetochore protein NDC80
MSTLPPMANAMRTDPRPINDKAYMNACIKNLTQYLLSNGYDQVVSTKSLARPSATEFTNIITYLLRKIDPTFNSFGSKFEDEVAQAFKRIGYPLNVSKTALAAVGSPHTWPALLSALTWLIELLNCDEATPKEEDWKNTRAQQQLDVKEIEERGARTFYKFVSESYLAFLLGNDERVVYCEDKFIECFERDTAIVAQKVDEITDWNAHLVASMEQLRNTTNE